MPRHRNSSIIRSHQNRMHEKISRDDLYAGDLYRGGYGDEPVVPHTQEEISAMEAAAAQKAANQAEYEAETIICQECGQTWSYQMLDEPFCGNCGSGDLVDTATGKAV